jgi:peptide/nickel transport system permease protein
MASKPCGAWDNGAGERIYVASQWQLMWWRFRKHHLAMAAGIVVVCFYLVALLLTFSRTDPGF